MANQEHLEILLSGVDNWNKWRAINKNIEPDLKEANFRGISLVGANLGRASLWRANLKEANLKEANLKEVDLTGADLQEAIFWKANLFGATLYQATLYEANLMEANLRRADLRGAIFWKANLMGANLSYSNLQRANLEESNLRESNLREANLVKANLMGANLKGANLENTNLEGANLEGANLENTLLIKTILSSAILSKSSIYGISAWDVKLDNSTQNDLVITPDNQPMITVDNIKVAQFVYLLLNTKEIRDVINTMTGKSVLLLGRFGDRKKILDAMAGWLRKSNLLPIIMDFEQPDNKDFTETVRTLAGLCKYVIADLTSPKSVQQEIAHIAPFIEMPIIPLLEKGNREYSMFKDMNKYHWVLPVVEYENENELINIMKKRIVDPAEDKLKEITLRKKT